MTFPDPDNYSPDTYRCKCGEVTRIEKEIDQHLEENPDHQLEDSWPFDSV